MLHDLHRLIHAKTDFLYRVLIQTPFFFVDLWSFVHLLTGAVLMLLLGARRCSRPFAVLFLLLFGYEILELSFGYLAINLFRPEILPDQVTDIAVGMLGGLLGCFVRRHWPAVVGRARRPRAASVLQDLVLPTRGV